MPSDLVTVALDAENWERDSEHGPDMCDLVQVAQLFSYLGTEEGKQLPAVTSIPAFSKLPLARHGPDKALEILNEAKGHIQEMKALLI
jgi:hypothetical protein